MSNTADQPNVVEILKELNHKFDKLSNWFYHINERLTNLDEGQTKLNEKITILEEKLLGQQKFEEKISAQLDKRISNSGKPHTILKDMALSSDSKQGKVTKQKVMGELKSKNAT